MPTIKRRPQVRRNANGTARIQRESYSTDAEDWWSIRKKVWDRDGGRCQSRLTGVVCGVPGNEVHHIITLSRGGTTSMGNLLTLCSTCHDKRHRHTIDREKAKPANPWGRKPKLPVYKP